MLQSRLPLVAFFILATACSAIAQRGGRSDGSNRRPNPREAARGGNELSDLNFSERLWYGAGGTFLFQGGNGYSFAAIGLTPQVGYKFTDWFSAGPRLGATNFFVKGDAVNSSNQFERRRYSLLDLTVGGFARARYRALYVQAEFNTISSQTAVGQGSVAFIDDRTNEISKVRTQEQQLQVGVGYNPSSGSGSLGSDIGIYYNLFDDVNSFRSPLEFRFMLTFRY